MGEMDVKPFIWAGLVGRGLRFGLEAVVIGIYGQVALDKMMWLLDHEMIIGILLILGFIATYFAWKWWDGIAIETETS
jgi:membrane protein DedA with SNARE-associated domain